MDKRKLGKLLKRMKKQQLFIKNVVGQLKSDLEGDEQTAGILLEACDKEIDIIEEAEDMVSEKRR